MQHRLPELRGLFFLTISIFWSLALISFNPNDPSFHSWGHTMIATNICGIFGSFLADISFQFFGVSIWIVVAAFFVRSRDLFRNKSKAKSQWVKVLLFAVTLMPLIHLYFSKRTLFSAKIYPGGIIGLGVSEALVRIFNSGGVQILLWGLLTAWTMLFFEDSLKDLAKTVASLMKRYMLKSKIFVREYLHNRARNKTLGQKQERSAKPISAPTQMPLFSKNEDLKIEEPEFATNAKRKVILKFTPPKKVENWKMPSIQLLEDPPASRIRIDRDEIRRKAEILLEKLKMFKIEGQIVDARTGPLVTMYEFKPNPDVKISEVSNLEDDLSLALSSESVRVMGQIPGTDVVGIETANSKREVVSFKDLLAEEKFWKDETSLPIALGKNAGGDSQIVNLRTMPHLLIAGTTGSGKSVFVRSLITGFLLRHSPKTLRLLLVDPKMVDLADFRDVPHLILPHVTEPKKAVTALRWAVKEMDKRYRSLSTFSAAKLEIFNEKVAKLSSTEITEHAENQGENTYYYQPQPYIVIIVDELADLMVAEKQNIEPSIQRLAQKARACGIHLIFATQTPRKEVVTGLIKSNFPGRIALKVSSPLDSRIILEETGAERLLPNGDMLFLAPGVSKPARHHGPYLSDREITDIVNFWSEQAKPEYDELGLQMLEGKNTFNGGNMDGQISEEDAGEEYDLILKWTLEQKTVSASLLQRRFSIGYPKAARFIEIMEAAGVVGAAQGSKARQVQSSLSF